MDWNPGVDFSPIKIEIIDRNVYFTGPYNHIGSVSIPPNNQNFLVDQFTGLLVKTWGKGETANCFVVKDKYLFTGLKTNPICEYNGGGITYYDMEYSRYASHCLPSTS